MNFHLILVAILEGLTEFLPVSSTAHVILLSKFLSIDTASSYIKFYLLFIQLGALVAGIALFSKKLLTDKKLFLNICISFIPSAVVGLLLYKLFKQLLEGNMILIGIALAAGGIIFIYLEKVFMKRRITPEQPDFGTNEITSKKAFLIGLAQAAAIIPGVSRSGATIIAGIFLGIKKAAVIEYTFILALPTMAAAVLYDAYKSKDLLSGLASYGELWTGFIVAGVVAFITLSIFKKYISRISLTGFGWYRIILAIVVLTLFI